MGVLCPGCRGSSTTGNEGRVLGVFQCNSQEKINKCFASDFDLQFAVFGRGRTQDHATTVGDGAVFVAGPSTVILFRAEEPVSKIITSSKSSQLTSCRPSP